MPSLHELAPASLAYIGQRALPDRLVDLDIRLLVIFGADDRRWRSSSAQLYDIVPNGRIEMLPHVGHSPMFEAPEITTRLLLEFVESSPQAPLSIGAGEPMPD